jgi:hypothetical protein
VQYTAEQLEGFKAAYKERWRLTYWPSAFILLLLLLSLFFWFDWIPTLWLCGLVGVNAISFIIYRCPACGRHFGGRRLHLYLVCPNCGVQLGDETRQSSSVLFAPLMRPSTGGHTEARPLTGLPRVLSVARGHFLTAVLLIMLVLGVGYLLGYLPHDELGWHSVGQTSLFIYVGIAVFCCGLFLMSRYGERLSEIEYLEAHDEWLADSTTRGVQMYWAFSAPGWIRSNLEARRLLTRLRTATVLVCLPVLWLLLWLFVNAR